MSDLTIEIVAVDNASEALAYLASELRRMWHALLKKLKSFIDWLNTPQVRRWMRQAGLMPPRRKQISTKRARIYRAKMG